MDSTLHGGAISYEQVYKAALLTFFGLFWISAWYVYKLKIRPHRIERLPRKTRPEYLSREIVDRILKAEDEKSLAVESCDWLNLIFKWFYAELAPRPTFFARFEAFFEDLVLNFRRSRTFGAYITATKLIDIQLGTSWPGFSRVRLITKPTEDLPITTLVTDVKYTGGILGIARLDIIGGWQLFIRARLVDFSGPLYLMVQDTNLFYAMGRFDDLKVRCQLILNGVQFKWLNWLVSKVLLPELMRRKLVLPAMKAKFLVTPEQLDELLAGINVKKEDVSKEE